MGLVILSDRSFLACNVAVVEPVDITDEDGRQVKTKIVLNLGNQTLNSVVLTVDEFSAVNKTIVKALTTKHPH
jgi:hypothetical protein